MSSFFNDLASASIIDCQQSGCNVIACEDDVSIFEKVFIQLRDKEAIATIVGVRLGSSLDDEE